MEKVFANKIEHKIRDVLPPNIFGYIKGKGTEDAIDLIFGMNGKPKKGYKKALVFTDAAKAFPSLDHQLVVEMCKAFGADHKVQSVISTYLSGRKRFVQIGGSRSED